MKITGSCFIWLPVCVFVIRWYSENSNRSVSSKKEKKNTNISLWKKKKRKKTFIRRRKKKSVLCDPIRQQIVYGKIKKKGKSEGEMLTPETSRVADHFDRWKNVMFRQIFIVWSRCNLGTTQLAYWEKTMWFFHPFIVRAQRDMEVQKKKKLL